MKTDKGLHILQLYHSKMLIDLEQDILKLSYTDLEFLIDRFNGIGEFDLAQMLFNRKIII